MTLLFLASLIVLLSKLQPLHMQTAASTSVPVVQIITDTSTAATLVTLSGMSVLLSVSLVKRAMLLFFLNMRMVATLIATSTAISTLQTTRTLRPLGCLMVTTALPPMVPTTVLRLRAQELPGGALFRRPCLVSLATSIPSTRTTSSQQVTLTATSTHPTTPTLRL